MYEYIERWKYIIITIRRLLLQVWRFSLCEMRGGLTMHLLCNLFLFKLPLALGLISWSGKKYRVIFFSSSFFFMIINFFFFFQIILFIFLMTEFLLLALVWFLEYNCGISARRSLVLFFFMHISFPWWFQVWDTFCRYLSSQSPFKQPIRHFFFSRNTIGTKRRRTVAVVGKCFENRRKVGQIIEPEMCWVPLCPSVITS